MPEILLAEIDPRPFQAMLDQAEGQLAKDQATLTNARVDLERYKDLIAQQAIPQQQLDTQGATVGQLEGTVKSDQAAVESAKLNVIYSHITSPINGRVGLRQVDPGNMVHATDANGLLVIAQLQPITVVFTLPEDSIPRVMQKWHTGADLPVEAYNRDKTQKLATGRLANVDNQIDPNTGTLKLKAVFDNEENTLFPNQFVNARLLLETRQNQVIIPSVAIQRGSQGTFVYVVTTSTARQRRRPRCARSPSVSSKETMRRSPAAFRRVTPWSLTVRTNSRRKLRRCSRRPRPLPCTTGRGTYGYQPPPQVSPSRLFILRPVATSLFMAGIVLVGVVAFRQLPVSALPQVDYPTIQVQTFYPGASPDVMASSVTGPLERQFGQVPGLTQMTSISSFGSSIITMQFSLGTEHRRGRTAGAGRHQRRLHLSPARSAEPPDLQQNQSRRTPPS